MRLFGMSPDDTQGFIMLVIVYIIYLLRHNKPFDTIWEIFKIVMIIIFVICSFGLLAGAVKRFFK